MHLRVPITKVFGKVDEIYVDRKRDAALLLKKVVENYSKKVKIEKHDAMVGDQKFTTRALMSFELMKKLSRVFSMKSKALI